MTATTSQLLDRRRSRPAVAFIEGATGRRITWADVAATADAWQARDLAPGTRIGLHLADPLATAGHFLAALATGATIVPLNPDGAPGELAAQVVAAGLAGVVTDTAEPSVVAALSATGIAVLTGAPAGWAVPARPPVGGSRAALVLASSGTTGAPKLIPLTETQLLHTATGVVAHLGLDDGERGYSPLPLFHINGLVVGLLSTLVAGSSLVVDRRFSRRSFWSVVEREAVTWLNLVPAILTVLGTGADRRGAGAGTAPQRVRLARSASAPLAAATRERFEAATGIPVLETYGMTEAGSQIAATPQGASRPGSVGRPVALDLRVVDGDRRPVATGQVGSVEIRGANVTTDYWLPAGLGRDIPIPTPATEADGWLVTGDVGRLDGDGYLTLVGRVDDVINRGGEKVQPREIEEVILADPRVAVAVVVGRPHPTVGEEPVAYVLPATDTGPDAGPGPGAGADLIADLAARCRGELSRFKWPAEIVVAATLPAGPTGKVRRSQVRVMAATATP